MSLLKNIEEVAVEIQQQLIGGAGCSCGCSCSCTCGGSHTGSRSGNYTNAHSSRQTGHFRAVRG